MLGRPCILCGRPGIRVSTAPGVTQHLCKACLTARSEAMPKGFPKTLKPAAKIPTREPKGKRKTPSTKPDSTSTPPPEDPKP